MQVARPVVFMETPRHAYGGPPVVEMEDASFGYDGRPITSHVDLKIHRGESVAVLGHNGSGKSTLVKGLLGLNDHLAGDVLVFGSPLASMEARRRVGYVPQRHTLSASIVTTIGEVVAIGRLPHTGLFRRLGQHDRRMVARALEMVGLGGLENRDVTHLSGGQQRRVLIARALAAEPDILVMDEPTAGVDAANQAELAQTMRRLSEHGITQLTVTHELEILASAISRAIVVTGGRIVADGHPQAVLEGRAAVTQPRPESPRRAPRRTREKDVIHA